MYDLLESDENDWATTFEVDGVRKENLKKNWFKMFWRFQSKIT